MSTHVTYPTDLTEAQWQILYPLLPPRKWRAGRPGRPPCSRRQVINGILYVTKTGCQWRMLPNDFPPVSTVRSYFYAWRNDSVWDELNRRSCLECGGISRRRSPSL